MPLTVVSSGKGAAGLEPQHVVRTRASTNTKTSNPPAIAAQSQTRLFFSGSTRSTCAAGASGASVASGGCLLQATKAALRSNCSSASVRMRCFSISAQLFSSVRGFFVARSIVQVFLAVSFLSRTNALEVVERVLRRALLVLHSSLLLELCFCPLYLCRFVKETEQISTEDSKERGEKAAPRRGRAVRAGRR